MIDTPLASTLLALAATFLGFSLLVQVFQEVYKYLTSSKSRSYVNTLVDFLGPHAYQLLRPGTLPELQARGPFQLLRRRPTGRLQPLEQPELVSALERTAAPWIRRALDALHTEGAIEQGAVARPSPAFRDFQRQLDGVRPGSPGYGTAVELRDFLATWGVTTGAGNADRLPPGGPASDARLDSRALLLALRHRFLPAVVQADTHFSQLAKNVEHAYRRRNLRQTFTFGFLLAVTANQPIGRIYDRATAIPLDQAIAATEALQAVYEQEVTRDTTAVRQLEQLHQLANGIMARLPRTDEPTPFTRGVGVWAEPPALRTPGDLLFFLFGCLVTALLISFGAPVWNDLAGTVLRLNRGGTGSPRAPASPKAAG